MGASQTSILRPGANVVQMGWHLQEPSVCSRILPSASTTRKASDGKRSSNDPYESRSWLASSVASSTGLRASSGITGPMRWPKDVETVSLRMRHAARIVECATCAVFSQACISKPFVYVTANSRHQSSVSTPRQEIGVFTRCSLETDLQAGAHLRRKVQIRRWSGETALIAMTPGEPGLVGWQPPPSEGPEGLRPPRLLVSLGCPPPLCGPLPFRVTPPSPPPWRPSVLLLAADW